MTWQFVIIAAVAAASGIIMNVSAIRHLARSRRRMAAFLAGQSPSAENTR